VITEVLEGKYDDSWRKKHPVDRAIDDLLDGGAL
jgi:hypothetical protein